MPDHWGFCDEWNGGRFRAFLTDKSEEFLSHVAQCGRCVEAQKRYDDFQKEMSKCADGTCGHGHAGDPPGDFGGNDF
mgnify:CR=1 FL=1